MTTPPREQWPREAWLEALYASDLRPTARHIAEVFANHARDGTRTWVEYKRLTRATGLARSTAIVGVQDLIEAGYLTCVAEATPRKAPIYELTTPQGSGSRTSGSRTPGSRTPAVREPDPRGPGAGPNQIQINSESNLSREGSSDIAKNARTNPQLELLARFEDIHPGHGRDVLEAAIKRHSVSEPSAYFRNWTDDQIRNVSPPAAPPAPPCTTCNGSGWIENSDGDPVRKCDHGRG